MLTVRVMLNHHDTTCSTASRDEVARGVEHVTVATFLKPHFRIGVAPASGQLQVHVEVRGAEPRVRLAVRH